MILASVPYLSNPVALPQKGDPVLPGWNVAWPLNYDPDGPFPSISSGEALILAAREDATGRLRLFKALQDPASPAARDRLAAEARAMQALAGVPGIVRGGTVRSSPQYGPCLELEYVPGTPMDAVIEHRAEWGSAQMGRLVLDLLDIAGAVHDTGNCVGDLKPDNVIVTPSGYPVLIDLTFAGPFDVPRPAALNNGEYACDLTRKRIFNRLTDLRCLGTLAAEALAEPPLDPYSGIPGFDGEIRRRVPRVWSGPLIAARNFRYRDAAQMRRAITRRINLQRFAETFK